MAPTGTGTAGRRRIGRIAGAAITAIVASTLAPGAAAPAFAATPPVAPQNIVVFPDRDFVGLEEYVARAGQTATFTITRNNVVSGMAQGVISAAGALEVNHPGGVAWGTGPGAPNVTPNIKAGDVVTVDFSGGGSDSAVTQSPTVTTFTHTPGSTRLVVNGTLGAPGGPDPITGQLEQRIVEPALLGTDVARRDVRAGDSQPGVFSSTLTFLGNTFTATYDFTLASTADIAAGGQMRVLTWMATDAAANRQGLTIAEFGEVGGPVGGVPPGPGSVTPNAPANVSGVRGNLSLTASWDVATTIVDGSAVTGYILEIQPVGGGLISRHTLIGADVASHAVGGLTNGTPYNISVRAISAAGQGLEGTGGPVTPSADVATVPGAPTAVGATAGNASATVTWTAPVDDGGSPITGYSVRVVNAANVEVGALRPAAAGATSLNVTGLDVGIAVRFQVQATNGGTGTGAFSALSTAVTPNVAPGAPTIGTATAGNASATVTWTAPAANGGTAITGYSVRVVNAANVQVGLLRPAAAGATSLKVTGLVNGTAVRFQAKATNAMGTSAFSALSNPVTATPPVAAVTRLSDFNRDGRTDLVARDSAGRLWLYAGNGTGGFLPRRLMATRWSGVNKIVTPGDVTGDGNADVLGRNKAGALRLYSGNGRGAFKTSRLVGARGWNAMTAIIAAGDMTGDKRPDVLTRDSAGRLWLYPTLRNGSFQARRLMGTGWAGMTAIIGAGDLNGDAKADLLARDKAGKLWLYRGNGTGRFSTRTLAGTGWRGMTALVTPGNWDRAGGNDLLARDGAGKLWLYPGNNAGKLSVRRQIGGGLRGYTIA